MNKMKFTFIRTDKSNQKHMRVVTIERFMERIQVDTKDETVAELRSFIKDNGGKEYYRFYNMHKLPRIYPAIELSKDDGEGYMMKHFNGIVLLDINNIKHKEVIEQVKLMAQSLPMTLAAFVGSSGRSVKIIVRTARQNGEVPQREEEAANFYQRAYKMAINIYNSILPHPVVEHDVSGGLIPTGTTKADAFSFRMPLDSNPFYNEKAIPMIVPDWEAHVVGATTDHQETAIENDERISKGTQNLITFMNQRYELRYNTIMGYTEYRPKDSLIDFMPVDDRTKNSFSMEARLAGLDVWDKDITRFVMSKMITNYDPIDEYLWRVHNKWDGKDHIRNLARRVPTDNPLWADWFYTWFLGMVAQWLGRNKNYGNSAVPLLISRQGYNKSTFCKSLIPNELQWGYNDSLILSDKKAVLQAMSQFLLINLDEFNAISPKVQEGFLKNIIQLANVKAKRPYGKHVEVFPRMASFIATTNMTDILADPSGSRRFIGIELTGPIKIGRNINHEQLYAQAYNAILNGEPYWFDAAQTALIMKSNQKFQMQQPIEQFFLDNFDIDVNENNGEYLTATAIYTQISQIPGVNIQNTNVRAFGRWLKNLDGLHHKDSNKGTKYLVCRKKTE